MNIDQLLVSAKKAITNLTNEYVTSVAVGWNSTKSHATLRYYLSRQPTDDDVDLCSCALAELEAEFSGEIQTACDECIFATEPLSKLDSLSGWVYVQHDRELAPVIWTEFPDR
jgi:hypothetical protein